MRVLAARFVDRTAAEHALDELRRRFDLGEADVSVAPMGSTDQPDGSVFLLAGRFRESRVEQVRRMVEGDGGMLVANVDEGWTRPRIKRQGDARPARGWSQERKGSLG